MIYRFADFELDLAKKELRQSGETVAVEPQVFILIAFLIEHQERVVSRDEIFENVWDGRVVSDSALSSRIKSARKALGDDGKAQRFIRTIHGQGFRFVAELQPGQDRLTVSEAAQAVATPDTAINTLSAYATRPSIAVLPFRLIGDAGTYATIADGLPHELITELARLRWLFVIARGSSFRLRDEQDDFCRIGRILGVRYCITGSVEVSSTRLTVTTELIDTRGGDVFWAERFAGFVDDVHAMRDEIRTKILTSLELQIPLHEAADARLTGTHDLDAWSAYHLGLQHLYRFNTTDNAIAAALFEQAVARDPAFARAHAGISAVHFHKAFMRHTDNVDAEIALARSVAQRGVEIDSLDPFVNFTMGRSYWLDADLDQALAWLQRAISLSPNYAQGNYACAWTQSIAGRGEEGRKHVDLAMQLSPLDPLYYAMLGTRSFAHMAEDENIEAAHWASRAARSPGAHVLIAMIAAAAEMLAGHEPEAQVWADSVRERNPTITREDFFHAFPMKAAAMRTRVSQALQRLQF